MVSVVASVFEQGKLPVKSYEKKTTDASSPPRPLLIVTPTEAGSYPVILFLHGFFMRNCYYRQLLEHMASHGYVAVAPQLSFTVLPACNGDAESADKATNLSPSSSYEDLEFAAMATIRSSSSSNGDIDSAAAVANWLPQGLQSVLPDGVQADFQRLALAGHSKGGHTAFALATKKYAKTTLDFSVLLGIDPVAGFQVFNHKVPISPSILTYKPNSLGINIPVLVVGTGLGDKGKLRVIPPCAPSRLNHAEFFNECKPPCNYFVAKDYGHMDMLDDDAPEVALIACKCGKGCRRKVRRSIAGLAIAFLEAFLDGNKGDLAAVVADPSVAPAALDPVEEKQVSRLAVLSRL